MIIFLIFLCYWLGLSLRYALIPIAIAFSLILLALFIKKFSQKTSAIAVIIFALGVGVSFIKIDTQRTSYSGIVIDSKQNYFLLLSKGEPLYVYEKNNEYEIGDYLKIEGEKQELAFVSLESQFDFQDYLNKKGVKYELEASNITVQFSNPLRIKKQKDKFLSHFSSDQQSLIKALLFSERDDSSDIDNIAKLHISRLASASGIFIYAYLAMLNFIISKIKRNDKPSIIPLLILFPYFIFTFPRFTVIRILILEIFRYFNRAVLDNKYTSFTIIGFTGMLFLLIDYRLAYQMSFIMGFTIPITISFIRNATYRYKGIKKKVMELVLTYTSAIPFELKFYNGINPFSAILITVLSPLFILTATASLISFYGVPIYSFVGLLIDFLSNILDTLAEFAFQINAPPMTGIFIIIFEILFILLLYYQSIHFIPFIRIVNSGLLLFLVVYSLPISHVITTEVCFINVGQGDACLIRKGSTAVLIDTGGNKYTDIAKETLIPFLQKKRIYDIDLVICTHGDFDHVGALDSLIENYYVKEAVNNESSFPITIGGLSFYNYNNHITANIEENERSLVVGFTLSNTSYLITGDAPIKVEKNIMKEYEHIDCDILKVGHHGSDTSTCDEFVKYLSPKEAVISCGRNNKYGHPTQAVLNTLKNNNVLIRRTDLEGTIIYKSYIFM